MSDSAPRQAAGIFSGVAKRLWPRVKGPCLFALPCLAVIWAVLPNLPETWGIRFGAPYRAFFSLAVLGAALFFVLLNWGPIRQPSSPLATFSSILLVYVATVGGVMSFGLWYYPQFELPASGAEMGGAEARGKQVFLSATGNCFACHSIEAIGIRGGTRGPDLSAVGGQAASRKPGVAAADYLRESILAPAACFAPLPGSGLGECLSTADPAKTYPPLMPPGFRERLDEKQIDDLVAFLVNLKDGK